MKVAVIFYWGELFEQGLQRGKEVSDYDKYKPWVGEDFSGKVEYELDNKEKFEIYRDFNKKNPIEIIYYLKPKIKFKKLRIVNSVRFT